MTFTRRRLLAASGAFAAAASLAPGAAFAQANPEAVIQIGALPDHLLGKADAPVSFIEYASLTCPHCAVFHSEVFPKLKSEYIDKGKVRYVLREFPLDLGALAGAMLARYAAGDQERLANPKASVPAEDTARYYGLVDVLFARQETWATARNLEQSLFTIVKQLGFTEEKFKTALTDEKLYQAITKQKMLAQNEFEVRGTPSFFVNGKKTPRGAATFEEISKIIDAEVKS